MVKTAYNPDQANANMLLGHLGTLQKQLVSIESEANRAIEGIRNEYADKLNAIRSSIVSTEKELIKLAETEKTSIFGKKDRIDLVNGALIYSIQKKVKKVKGMLKTLKRLGFKDVIKIAESVDWDKISKWPDDQLAEIGTKRVSKEVVSYELKSKPFCY